MLPDAQNIKKKFISNGPETVDLGPIWAGGLKTEKLQFAQNWLRVGLWCKGIFPPIFGVPEALVQVPGHNSMENTLCERGGGGGAGDP